ncbi:MAG: CE1759 family FMN reductase [Nocardioides sp.]
MTRLVVVSAGVGVPSATRLLADRLTESAVAALRGDVEVEVVELRPLARALADHVLTGFPGEELGAAIGALRSADGVIVVTPVYAASYSGLFKMFVDVLEPDVLDGTPVLIAATAGTARHSLVLDHALRPLFVHQRAVVVPTGVFAATDDFGTDADLSGRVARATGELAMLVGPSAVAEEPVARRPRLSAAADGDPVPFEQLLRQASAR